MVSIIRVIFQKQKQKQFFRLHLDWGTCPRLNSVEQRLVAHESRHATLERLESFSETVRHVRRVKLAKFKIPGGEVF